MTIDPQIVVPWAVAALFFVLGIAMAVTLLALDRARRAEDRATAAEAMLEQRTRAFADAYLDTATRRPVTTQPKGPS